MSRSFGYACLSHDPALPSEHWLNHGLDALADALTRVRAGSWPWVVDEVLGDEPEPVVVDGSEHNRSQSPIYWLRAHPECRIAIYNEYGECWALDDGLVQVSGSDDRRTRRPVRTATGQATGQWVEGAYPPEGEVECTCISPVLAVTHPDLFRADGWVRCTTCNGLLIPQERPDGT